VVLRALLAAVLKAHNWSRLARWRAIEAAVHVCALHTRRITELARTDPRNDPQSDARNRALIHVAEATCHQVVDALVSSMQGPDGTFERPLTDHDSALFRLKPSKAPLLAGMLPSWPDAPRPVVKAATRMDAGACALCRFIDQELSDMGLGATVRLCETSGAVLTAPGAKGPLVRGCAAAHVLCGAPDPEVESGTKDARASAATAVMLIVRDIAAFAVLRPEAEGDGTEVSRSLLCRVLDDFEWHNDELFGMLLMIGVSSMGYRAKQTACRMILARIGPTAARRLLNAKAPRMFDGARRPRGKIAAAAEACTSPYGPQIGADPAHSWVVHARICEAHDTALAWALTCFPMSQDAILRAAGYEKHPIPRSVRLQVLDRLLVGGATERGRAGMRVAFPEDVRYSDVERVGLGFARMWRPTDADPFAAVEMRTDEELWKIDPLRFLCSPPTVALLRAWKRPAFIGHSSQRPGSPLASAQALLLQRVLLELLQDALQDDPLLSFPFTRTVRVPDDPARTADVDVLEAVALTFPTQLGKVIEDLMRCCDPSRTSEWTCLETAWPQLRVLFGLERARLERLLDAVLRAARYFIDRGFLEEAELVPLLRFLIGPCRCRVRSYTNCSFKDPDKADERVEAVLLDAWNTKRASGHGPGGRAERWAELGARLKWDDDRVQARDGTLPIGWSRAANAWVRTRGVQPGAEGAPSKRAAALPATGQCRVRHFSAEYKPGDRLRVCTSWGTFALTMPNGIKDGVGISFVVPKPEGVECSKEPEFVSLSRCVEDGASAVDDDEPVVTAHRDPADWTNDPEKKRQCIDLVSDEDEEAAHKKQKTGAEGCAQ
jgi:hypothetical protein